MISIIIPHYNSSNNFLKNLKKLEHQSLNEFEIIVIDDCSKKSEYEKICCAINNSQLNIKIFRNSVNLGPGTSRNKGITEATGEYVTFLDADDYFENTFIEQITNIIKLYYPDMIMCNYFAVNNSTKLNMSILSTREIMKSGFINNKKAFVYIKGAPWAKCYKKEILIKNNVTFLPIKRNEDLPFTKLATMNCNRIYYISEPLYNYVYDENSLMHTTNLLDENNCLKAINKIKNELLPNYVVEFKSVFNYECIYSIVFTKLIKNESNDSLNLFLKKNKISFSKYDFKYKPYIIIVFILIKLRCYFLLRLISKYRERKN